MQVQRLFSFHSHKLEELLLSLSPEDRRYRFSAQVSDASISAYVRKIQWPRVCIFGMLSADGQLLGAVELVPTKTGTELAIAVRTTHKRQGIGRQLMQRALLHAKLYSMSQIHILCASDNTAMLRLARETGMVLTRDHGEVEGQVNIGPPTPADYIKATLTQVEESQGASRLWYAGMFASYRKLLGLFVPRRPS